MAAKSDDLSKLLPTAQEMMEKLALAEAEKAEAAARKQAEKQKRSSFSTKSPSRLAYRMRRR